MRRRREIAMLHLCVYCSKYEPGPLCQCSSLKLPRIRCSWGGVARFLTQKRDKRGRSECKDTKWKKRGEKPSRRLDYVHQSDLIALQPPEGLQVKLSEKDGTIGLQEIFVPSGWLTKPRKRQRAPSLAHLQVQYFQKSPRQSLSVMTRMSRRWSADDQWLLSMI